MSIITEIAPKFAAIGARIKEGRPRFAAGFTIDVKRDGKGQFFEVVNPDDLPIVCLDTRPDDRHLVLMVKEKGPHSAKMRFLCGHDEREWFTAAVPGALTTVPQAKQALKAPEVVKVEAGRVKTQQAQRRCRRVIGIGKIIRQGEFTFIPQPDMRTSKDFVMHRNEPMSRGAGSKPHMADYLMRFGGQTVRLYKGREITTVEFNALNASDKRYVQNRIADARVYVKGCIRHKDHSTVRLGDVWHLVSINTERTARGAVNVRFMD